MAVKPKFNFNKFRADIENAVKVSARDAIQSITTSDKRQIGEAVITEMKDLISKGISPIAEEGRFEAYKWVGKANAINKVAGRLSSSRRKAARALAKDAKQKHYPYSVQKKFPDKRERPVNLYLSGKFLNDLTSSPLLNGLTIGFKSKLSEKKEQGHREGVNGQPQRPIIPIGRENFSPAIYRRVVDTVLSILRQK